MNDQRHSTEPRLSSAGDHSADHGPRFATSVRWGLLVGVINAAAPLAIWGLSPTTVHALAITLIAAVYIGFAVADGRPNVIAVECVIVALFVLVAAVALAVSPWLIVVAYVGHGCKDLWQHRTRFVTGTRWWPPFCFAVDLTVATIIAIALLAGQNLG